METEPPEGYKSLSELAEELGVSRNTMQHRLTAMLRKGVIVVVECRHKPKGVIRKIKYYGPPI